MPADNAADQTVNVLSVEHLYASGNTSLSFHLSRVMICWSRSSDDALGASLQPEERGLWKTHFLRESLVRHLRSTVPALKG